MTADDDLASKIENILRPDSLYPSEDEYSIFKLHDRLRNGNEDSYTPQLMSIGPLHHDQESLQGAEITKKQYLYSCLKYNPDIKVTDHVRHLRGIEEEVRKQYNEKDFSCSFSSDKFVTMMLLDGCFIIQFFILSHNMEFAEKFDPKMFRDKSRYFYICKDLFMVENQLPFFLLEHLYNFILTDQHRGTTSFHYLTLQFFQGFLHDGIDVHMGNSSLHIKHFIHLLLMSFLPSGSYPQQRRYNRALSNLPSATELDNLGVQFKKSKNTNFLDITYSNGVLEMPTLTVDAQTIVIFKNLIAMEQSHEGSTSYIIDYMKFMDDLVNTVDDIVLLKAKGIIESFTSNDKEACDLFNDIIADGTIVNGESSQYIWLIRELNHYATKRRHQWKAKLKKKYFSNPWTVLSLIGALILLFCTMVQTLFTVFPLSE